MEQKHFAGVVTTDVSVKERRTLAIVQSGSAGVFVEVARGYLIDE
jgi:hypothetical protein